VFAAGVASFDDLVYGGPLKSGYRPGEITFSLSAVLPNLRYMPSHLIEAMPMLLSGLAGLGWIAARWARLRRADGEPAARARRDLAVALAPGPAQHLAHCLRAAPGTASPDISRLGRGHVRAGGMVVYHHARLLARRHQRHPRRTARTAAEGGSLAPGI
jgi:hypothetical protein